MFAVYKVIECRIFPRIPVSSDDNDLGRVGSIPISCMHLAHTTLSAVLVYSRRLGCGPSACALWVQRISQPTVIVTRFEYANLFHTVTDWYSAYMTSRMVNLKKRPRLIFVDGHCKVELPSQYDNFGSFEGIGRFLCIKPGSMNFVLGVQLSWGMSASSIW